MLSQSHFSPPNKNSSCGFSVFHLRTTTMTTTYTQRKETDGNSHLSLKSKPMESSKSDDVCRLGEPPPWFPNYTFTLRLICTTVYPAHTQHPHIRTYFTRRFTQKQKLTLNNPIRKVPNSFHDFNDTCFEWIKYMYIRILSTHIIFNAMRRNNIKQREREKSKFT